MKQFPEYISFLDWGIEAWSGCANECLRSHFSSEILSSSCEELRDWSDHAATLPWDGSVLIDLLRERLLGIGNRSCKNSMFVVLDIIRRYGSYSLAVYEVRSSLWQQQLALFGWSRLWRYQVDTVRDGAGRLVEHAKRQSCCLQLDRGRSLDQIIRDFVILEFIAIRWIGELARARSNIEGEAPYGAQEESAEASTTSLASTGMLLRADTGCYLSPQSPILVGRERVCAFGNGSIELCCLCKKKKKAGK